TLRALTRSCARGAEEEQASRLPHAPLRLLLFRLPLERFRDADEAVTVGVEHPELFLGAQELARRQVAAVVAVHLRQPQRDLRSRSLGGAAREEDVLALAQREREAARQVRLRHAAVGSLDVGLQARPDRAQLADGQPAVAVAVELVKQAAAQVVALDNRRAVRAAGLEVEVVRQLFLGQLAVAILIREVK